MSENGGEKHDENIVVEKMGMLEKKELEKRSDSLARQFNGKLNMKINTCVWCVCV